MAHRAARTQKIFGVTVHGDFGVIVGLGCMLAAHRLGGDVQGWAMALAGGVLVHELGQLGALRGMGHRLPVELGLHGVHARTSALYPWQAILAALAGPAANALVALAVLLLVPRSGQLAEPGLLERFGLVCATLAVVELVPALPLDGGVALRALLEGATRGRGERWAQRVTIVLALLVAVAAYAASAFEVVAGAIYCAGRAARAVGMERYDLRDRAAQMVLDDAAAAFDRDDLARARELVSDVISSTYTPEMVGSAAELGAWIELRAGDARAAKTRLESMPSSLLPSAVLRATLRHVRGDATARAALDEEFAKMPAVSRVVPALVAFGHGKLAAELVTAGALEPDWMLIAAGHLFRGRAYEASAVVSQRAFERTNAPDHAYNAACALAQAQRLDEAALWLTKAVDAGFTDAELARTDEDLAPLRVAPAFAAALASLGGAHPYRA